MGEEGMDNNWKEEGGTGEGGKQNNGRPMVDLSREGPIDRCTEMLAEKIMVPSFWTGADQFAARPALLGGYSGVRQSLSRHILRLFGASIRWDQLVLVPNDLTALELFIRCCCYPGDVILCPAPFADPELPATVASVSGTVLLPIHLEDAPEMSIVDLQKAWERLKKQGRRVRALLLHNPHPILSWVGDGQRRLAHILEWAAEREIYLLVDESLAAMDLWEFSSCLGLLDHRSGGPSQWLVWIWSGAKHFSLPGLEFAALLPPQPHLIRPALAFLQLHPCAPLVQYLAAKLLDDFDFTSELFVRRKSRLEELRRGIIEGLAGMGVELNKLVTSEEPTLWIMADLKMFLAVPNFESERTLKEQFAHEGALLLTAGEQLGMADPGWFRIRVENSEERVAEMMDRMRKVLSGRRTEPLTEWQQMDMSKYGGAAEIPEVVVEEAGEKEEEEDGWKDEREGNGREEGMNGGEEELGGEMMEVGEWRSPEEEEEQWKMREEWDERKREEEEEGRTRREERGMEDERVEEEEDDSIQPEDDIIREVFSIFPKEGLGWRERKRMKEEDKKTNLKEENREKPELAMPNTFKLTDLSFIEELVKRGGQEEAKEEEKRETMPEGEFYDEASTEEEEQGIGGREEHAPEGREEENEEQVRNEQLAEYKLEKEVPLRMSNIDVKSPDNVDDSERIIGIIDKIFHEAVEIRDYSDIAGSDVPSASKWDIQHRSLSNPLPELDQRQHQQHQGWSRSDSGLAGESPPNYFTSPTIITDPDQHLYSIFETSPNVTTPTGGLEPSGFFRDDTIRSGDSAFISDSSPVHTSPFRQKMRRSSTDNDYDEKTVPRGVTALQLDDSGIFVDLPPGSLSIDFPLLVPTGHFNSQEVWGASIGQTKEEEDGEWKMEEKGQIMSEGKEGRTVVEMFTLEELRAMIEFGEDGGEMEEGEKEEEGWKPMENVENEQEQGRRVVKVREEPEGEEKEQEEDPEKAQQQQLASVLNEGATFCPKSSKEEKVAGGEGSGRRSREVPEWRPLDQLEEAERREREEREEEQRMMARMRKRTEEQGKKFSEELDKLEEKRRREEGEEGWGPGRSSEAVDVVAEWNARMEERRIRKKKMEEVDRRDEDEGMMEEDEGMKKKMEEVDGREDEERDEEVDVDLHFGGPDTVPEAAEIRWMGGPNEKLFVNKTVINVGYPEMEEKTEVKIRMDDGNDEEWKYGWQRSELEKRCWENDWRNAGGQEGRDLRVEIPGRSRYRQTHQRMEMTRRLEEEAGRRSPRGDEEALIIEHMNITELAYRGRGRMGRGERMVASISTRINRWTPDEWFDRIPMEDDEGNREEDDEEVEEEGRRRRRRGNRKMDEEEEEGMCSMKDKEQAGGGNLGSEEYWLFRNPGHSHRDDHCDPSNRRVYTVRKKRRRRARRGRKAEWEETEEPDGGDEWREEEEEEGSRIGERRRSKGRASASPERITVSTQRRGDSAGTCEDKTMVRHTPGSRWIVTSVYSTTDWGWEKVAMQNE